MRPYGRAEDRSDVCGSTGWRAQQDPLSSPEAGLCQAGRCIIAVILCRTALLGRRGSWSGRENCQHEQPPIAGVPDAMRHPFRRHDELAGFDRQLATLEQDQTLAFDDLIYLIHPGACVEGVKLAALTSRNAE